MRALQKGSAASWAPIAPDAVHQFTSSAGSSAYAADWPGVFLSSTNPKPRFIEIKSDAGGWISYNSTAVTIPTTNTVTSGSSGFEHFLANVPHQRMLPMDSTGYSIAFASSAYASVSMWGP